MIPTSDKERKDLPLFTFLTEYFPLSFIEVCRVAVAGNRQHNPGEPLHWAREKSTDQMNTAFRHMLDHAFGNEVDVDGCYHLAKAIWRLSAELQLTIERRQRDATGANSDNEAKAELVSNRNEDVGPQAAQAAGSPLVPAVAAVST